MPGPIPLDDRDIRILSVLSREGRISKAELARRVNLTPTPCWERLRRLEATGLVRAYRAEIELARLAPHVVVFVMVELERHRNESFQAFERTIARHDEVVAAWAIGGGFDYLLQVITRDIDSYQRLVDALLDAHLGMRRYFSYIVTKEAKRCGPPPLAALLRVEETD